MTKQFQFLIYNYVNRSPLTTSKKVALPPGATWVCYLVTTRGLLTKSTYGNGHTIGFTYDMFDRVTAKSYNGQTITYDQIGNPLQYRDGFNFTWSNGRQLTGITKGTDNISYLYNSDGLRASKTVNGTTTDYYWLEGVLLGQKTGNDYIIYLYDENGTAYGIICNNSYYYYVFNAQGDVVGIIDQNGTQVVSYDYSAWGEVLSITGTMAATLGQTNPIRYRGYYYDNETGFYYLQSRYYDPITQRFINADGLLAGVGGPILGYNLFAYCENNFVNKFDPKGNVPKWIKSFGNWVSDTYKEAEKAGKKAIREITKFTNSIKTSFSPANHIQKKHITSPTAILNFGTLLGKIGFSSTVTKQNKEPGLVHSASDVGNDASKYLAGINIFGWLGADVGVSSEINAFFSAQVTPWVHGEASVGLDGLGAVIGFDVGDTSYDFEINGGWGLLFPALAAPSMQFSGSPVYN